MRNKKSESMLNYKRTSSFLIPYSLFLILLASCSVSKQIARSANEDVLNTKALTTAHVGISIFEPAANKYWFNYQGDKYFVPASNTKLPTCYAAMKYLGDSLVGLRYSIINDTLISIRPSADPTFLHPDFPDQKVFSFLKKYRKVEIFPIHFTFQYLGSGWSWNDYQETYMAPRSIFPMYGNVVSFKLNSENEIDISPLYFSSNLVKGSKFPNGMQVVRMWDNNYFSFLQSNRKFIQIPFVPHISEIQKLLSDTLKSLVQFEILFPKGNFFKIIHSQPTDSLLKPMMHRSDNFFAEQSLLMVSNERLGMMNDEKIIDTLLKTDFKDLPQKPRWVDGSGLSRYNLFTPQDFVAILNKMKNEFGMERIKVILPTGGEGTISSYYKTDNGYIYGKTGTLSGVVAFSGFLYTKKGKLLIFSTLINNHQASATDVRRAIEKFLQSVRSKY
jgi:D-alanyl-D-alanine carboxypeptidase/D-alanyl-D-alanine-endopeptidase (penicillin-binding protein 4)